MQEQPCSGIPNRAAPGTSHHDGETSERPFERGIGQVQTWRNRMSMMKMIGAAVLLSASIASPLFAQDAGVYGPYGHGPRGQGETYYRSYGQVDPDFLPPRNNREYRNLQSFRFSGRDPSRVGGESPSLSSPPD